MAKKLWKDFILLLHNQQVQTEYDFNKKISYKYQITRDDKYLKENYNNEIGYYQKTE